MSSISSVSASAAVVAAETLPAWTPPTLTEEFRYPWLPEGSVISIMKATFDGLLPAISMPFLIWEHEKAHYTDIVATISEKTNLLPDIVQMVMPFLDFASSAGHPLTTRTTKPLPAYIPYISITIPWEALIGSSRHQLGISLPSIRLSTPLSGQVKMTGCMTGSAEYVFLDVNNSGADRYVVLNNASYHHEFLVINQEDAFFIHVQRMDLTRYIAQSGQSQRESVSQWNAWLRLNSPFIMDSACSNRIESLIAHYRMYGIIESSLESHLKKLAGLYAPLLRDREIEICEDDWKKAQQADASASSSSNSSS